MFCSVLLSQLPPFTHSPFSPLFVFCPLPSRLFPHLPPIISPLQQSEGSVQVLQGGWARQGGHPEGAGPAGGHRAWGGGQCAAAQVLDNGAQQNIQEPPDDGGQGRGEEPQSVTVRQGER